MPKLSSKYRPPRRQDKVPVLELFFGEVLVPYSSADKSTESSLGALLPVSLLRHLYSSWLVQHNVALKPSFMELTIHRFLFTARCMKQTRFISPGPRGEVAYTATPFSPKFRRVTAYNVLVMENARLRTPYELSQLPDFYDVLGGTQTPPFVRPDYTSLPADIITDMSVIKHITQLSMKKAAMKRAHELESIAASPIYGEGAVGSHVPVCPSRDEECATVLDAGTETHYITDDHQEAESMVQELLGGEDGDYDLEEVEQLIGEELPPIVDDAVSGLTEPEKSDTLESNQPSLQS